VLDGQTQNVLQTVIRRESRSLLQYLTESFPWTTPERQAAVDELKRLAEEDRAAVARVADYLRRNQVPQPYLGPFPTEFTNINFIGLDYAVRLLVKAQQRAIDNLEGDLRQLSDEGARDLVRELITIKHAHLKDLEALAADLPAATRR
jgi:hypothetical protein